MKKLTAHRNQLKRKPIILLF